MVDDTVMEEREELMVVSPSSGEAHSRKAHFLKPSATSSAAAASPNPSAAAAAACKGGLPVKVDSATWTCVQKWQKWVSQMRSSHQSTWKSAGILDAIVTTTYSIQRCEALILGLSEKWSPATNTFVFPWGEATVTLEDMMALGAYSVLGEPVFISPSPGDENKVTKLLDSRRELYNSPVKRACAYRWMIKFMGSGSEIEHEAFLAYWLSKFVFPFFSQSIGKSVIPIAVHLARGTRIALAPAVLASIYRALTLLKEGKSMSLKRKGKKTCVVSAPLAFVQVWAWERLPLLRPNPKRVEGNEPRVARWAGRTKWSFTAIVPAGGADPQWRWRPYDGVYMDVERWEVVENEELESFVRCVRVSKLVGLEEGCVEQYLPHRVARQFGMDQDLPARVAVRDDFDPEIAWSDYIRPVGDAKVYVPSRSYQPCVTKRYFEWWKKLKGGDLGMAPDISKEVHDEMDVDGEAVSEQSEDEMDAYDNVPLRVYLRRHTSDVKMANNAFGKGLEHEMDVYDNVPLRVYWRWRTSGVKKAKTAFGGKGRFKRSKRRYIQLFRRQRDVVFVSMPQRDARRHSVAVDSDSENSDKSSEKLMPAPMEASDSGRSCEIEGKHEGEVESCLFSGARSNENIVVQLSEARIDGRAEENIDLGGLEERVRSIEKIVKSIRAGKLPVNHR